MRRIFSAGTDSVAAEEVLADNDDVAGCESGGGLYDQNGQGGGGAAEVLADHGDVAGVYGAGGLDEQYGRGV